MKNNMKKLGVLLLLCVVAVGSYFVSGTYAKYTSEVNGKDAAVVAKWQWTFGSSTNERTIDTYAKSIATDSIVFDLFNTIKEIDTEGNEVDVATASSGNPAIIAPGTQGSFEIEITNESQVKATYAVKLEETTTGSLPSGVTRIPLEYCIGTTANIATTCAASSANWSDVVNSTTGVITNVKIDPTVIDFDTTGNANKASVTVKWRWKFEVNEGTELAPVYTTQDTIDTKLGFAADTSTASDVPKVEVKATVNVTQYDASES